MTYTASGEILKCAFNGLYYPIRPQERISGNDTTGAIGQHDNDNMVDVVRLNVMNTKHIHTIQHTFF